MATVEEMMDRYETDPDFKREVDEVLADGRVTLTKFLSFAKKHQVKVSPFDLPGVIAEARRRGLTQ